VKRSAPNWAVLRECGHKLLRLYRFRAAIKFYNSLLSSNSITPKQALHADLKLVPRAKISWALDILRAFGGLRGCGTCIQAVLQGLPICYPNFTANLRFKMRKMRRGVLDMTPLESDNKLVTYHSGLPVPS